MKRTQLLCFLLGVFSFGPLLASPGETPYNQTILRILQEMPTGGGYDTSARAFRLFQAAMALNENYLEVHPENATPSFCSSSTYLVFLKLVSQLQRESKLHLSIEAQRALLARGEPDGHGVWGRWNANGPGTARLVFELGLGRNFTKISEAEPGDFMKIFWTDKIGARERGHSVIFTGVRSSPEGRRVCFWSSNSASANQPAGMGEKCLAESKIHRAVFSRLQSLENLNHIPQRMATGTDTYRDVYLASLLSRASTLEEMCEKVDCH